MATVTALPYEQETEPFRSLFPHCADGIVYLDHAGTGPLPLPVVQAMERHLRRRLHGQTDLSEEVEAVERTRWLIAALLNAPSPGTIALMPNTTTALATVAMGLSWRHGDVIVVGAREFPANVYPWRALRRFGVELRLVPMPEGLLELEQLVAAIDARTRLVTVSAVQFLSGDRIALEELGEICAQRGIWLVVDGIQAVGAVRVDVQRCRISALACGGAKWLLAPHGTGFLYLAPPLQEELQPALLGWLAAEDPWNLFDYEQPLVSSARRFEGGSLNVAGIVGLCAALELLHRYGVERAEARVVALSGYLRELLLSLPVRVQTPEPPERRAGIVSISLPDGESAEPVFHFLQRSGVRCSLRMGWLRFSPHWYTTAGELEYAVEKLREALQRRGDHRT
jgi:selenocysteine lyase/cysteine desulfurase